MTTFPFHHDIRARLLQEFRNGRVVQSCVFVGPHGVCKLTLARWYAQALVCESPTKDKPCGSCAACRAVAAGAHPDVAVAARAEGQETVSIEAWRILQDRFTRTPLRAARSVMIVPDCERLSRAAQHACLKTLEEPRPASVLLLTASSPALLLATMRSRLTQIRLRPVPSPVLQQALEEADAALTPQDADALVRYARGIPGALLHEGRIDAGCALRAAHQERIAALRGAPLWRVQKALREMIGKESAHASVEVIAGACMLDRACGIAERRLLALLSRALTRAVNKDLAIDTLSIALAH